MLETVETTATEVYAHALNHGDRPVIHGAEIDYTDVHDGVVYHADLLRAAWKRWEKTVAAVDSAARSLAIKADLADRDGIDVREWPRYAEDIAAYRAARAKSDSAYAEVQTLKAKRDQNAQAAS